MTPAVTQARRAGIAFRVHEYRHDPATPSYGREAADTLAISSERVFKTLVVALADGRLAVAVLAVADALDLKAVAAALGAKKAAMAEAVAAERATGHTTGGISPLGQKRRLPLVVDERASDWETIYVSGGRRGLEIELAPRDLVQATEGHLAAIARRR